MLKVLKSASDFSIIEQKFYGHADKRFLERVFQKLLLNFTWWVNRKDAEGKNIFQGGNSNWRGPIYFPMNYLLIDAL